jgi:hypothetical protein
VRAAALFAPFARERDMIHEAIRDGDDAGARDPLSARADARRSRAVRRGAALEELLYVELIREQAEAIEAQSLLRALPTPANRDAAIRETEESSVVGRVFCVLARSRDALFHGVHA